MLPSHDTRQERIRACVEDLMANGIDLLHANEHEIRAVVRENLDYFQLMIGDESRPGQVVSMIRQGKRLLH